MTTERRFYEAPPQPMTEVGIRSTAFEDLYVILSTLDEQVGMGNDPQFQRATFQVMVNPLVPWIWYGGLVIAIGTLIAMWPGGPIPAQRGGSTGAQATRREETGPDDGPSSGSGSRLGDRTSPEPAGTPAGVV